MSCQLRKKFKEVILFYDLRICHKCYFSYIRSIPYHLLKANFYKTFSYTIAAVNTCLNILCILSFLVQLFSYRNIEIYVYSYIFIKRKKDWNIEGNIYFFNSLLWYSLKISLQNILKTVTQINVSFLIICKLFKLMNLNLR